MELYHKIKRIVKLYDRKGVNMSFPNIPNVNPDININREDVVNLLLASIAFEELGLSHIINAEAEKIQYVLGTIPGRTPPTRATTADLLNIDNSVDQTLKTVIKKEMLLESKLEDVLAIPILEPTGGLEAYGWIFQSGTETVPLGSDINYSGNGPLLNITHVPGTAPIIVGLTGIYNIAFVVNSSNNNPEGYSIFVNGASRGDFTAAGQSITALASLSLVAGDSVTIRNSATVPDPAVLRTSGISSSLLIYKVDA